MKTVIIDYNAGNVQSVYYALKRLGIEAEISDKPVKIKSADKVIFPGVGEAGSTMKYLRTKGLDTIIKELTQPVLGICLGMQLLCSQSEEGDTTCLNIFPNTVKRFKGNKKVPHVGWNSISNLKGELFKGVPENEYVYFVHSYYVEVSEDTLATCNYMQNFSASIQKNNFYAVQFHPEKSGRIGSRILKNFIEL